MSLSYGYPHWPPTEFKRMTVRERWHWRDLAVWEQERKEAARGTT